MRVPDPYELGQEFFRWEFATAVAGSILGINPFDQPDVQAAKDRTNEVLASGSEPDVAPQRLGRGALRAGRGGRLRLHPGVRQSDADERGQGARARGAGARARPAASSPTASGRATCTRPASCTRAGRRRALPAGRRGRRRAELAIPGKPFGFGKLIRAQAAGDFESLQERGRRVARIHSRRTSDAARNDRPRPHGRQHDEAARPRRARRQDVRPEVASTAKTLEELREQLDAPRSSG